MNRNELRILDELTKNCVKDHLEQFLTAYDTIDDVIENFFENVDIVYRLATKELGRTELSES